MDILFVNASSSDKAFQDLSKKYSGIETPTWALLLADSCRAKGFSVGILDAEAEQLSDAEAVNRITHLSPTFVCFVVYGGSPNAGTTCMIGASRTAKKLPSSFTTIFVGSHVSALPEDVLAEDFVDIILTNEGVYALHDLLALSCSNSDWLSHLSTVKGIGYKASGKCFINDYASVVPQERMDIDLPGYAWDLLPYKEMPLDLYRAHYWHANFDDNQRTPFAAIYTSLGCVHACGFCMINILNRTSSEPTVSSADSRFMRFWSVSWIKKQILQLKKLGVRTIKFSDELFFYNPKRYLPVLQMLSEVNHEFNIWCYARVDTVRISDLPLFKKAGINWLCLGIESGNRIVRKEISKGSFQDLRVEEVVKSVQDAGIFVLGNYIFGLPDDSLDTMNDTLDLALNMLTEHANFYTCVALPGSPLYQQCVVDGVDLPMTHEYEKYAFLSYEHQPLPSKFCSPQQILEFRDNAWNKYFANPAYHLFVESRLGTNALANVKGMASVKLKRLLLGD
jgi:anaerobic magnesium-protoporphyrin IX monomethyl ester cyclase